MIHRIEIAFLFTSFKCLRLESEQIGKILLDLEQLTSDTSLTLEELFWKWADQDFSGREAGRKSCQVYYDSLLSFEEKTDDAHVCT